ncbi:hypothetical protein PENSPDRAFT_449518 [Peniophora sp. CONT]|nr:hypothetical protein PENSPDRAFT_449518 [Peniophora sp. CONT]
MHLIAHAVCWLALSAYIAPRLLPASEKRTRACVYTCVSGGTRRATRAVSSCMAHRISVQDTLHHVNLRYSSGTDLILLVDVGRGRYKLIGSHVIWAAENTLGNWRRTSRGHTERPQRRYSLETSAGVMQAARRFAFFVRLRRRGGRLQSHPAHARASFGGHGSLPILSGTCPLEPRQTTFFLCALYVLGAAAAASASQP